jgi:hypothetical protein
MMVDKDKDKELTEEEKAQLKSEAEAAQELAARGHALPSDRIVDRP